MAITIITITRTIQHWERQNLPAVITAATNYSAEAITASRWDRKTYSAPNQVDSTTNSDYSYSSTINFGPSWTEQAMTIEEYYSSSALVQKIAAITLAMITTTITATIKTAVKTTE